MKKILILHTWGIGDTIMATPMMKEVKKQGYNVDVLLTSKANVMILKNNNFINNIFLIENKLSWIKFLFKKFLYYDILVSTIGINHRKVKTISLLLGIKKVFSKYSEDNTHRIIDNMYFLKDLNRNFQIPTKIEPFIYHENFCYIDKYIKKDKINIGFAIGSGHTQDYKRWDTKNYIHLFKKLIDINILVFIGPDEEEFLEIMQKQNNITIVSEKLNDAINIISNLNLLVGTDNGLMHVGYGLKIPTITLFGMTNEKEIGGYNTLINQNICLDISCRPCINSKMKQFVCDKELQCLKKISVNVVYKKIIKYIESIK